MRLAVDATPLIGSGTGVATFVRGLVAALAAGPTEVRAYALSWRGRGALAGAVPAGVAVAGRPMAADPLLRAWARWDLPPVEWFTGTVDVVHGTNFVVPPARRAGRVVTVHDLTSVRHPELCTPMTLRYPGLIRRAVATGAIVHTPTRAMADEVVELLSVPADRVAAVHNGLDRLEPGDPAAGRRAAGAERYVVAIGTVEPRKGLPLQVEAFDLVADADDSLHLVIAGPDGWGAEALRVAIAGARAADRIHRIGYVDGRARADLLAGALALAYPSVYEGFGLPPLEAMSVGVPVVASDAAALVEVLGDAADLVAVGDADQLATAIGRVVSDDAHRRRLVDAGRARAAAFSWEACAAGLVDLYARAFEEQTR